MKYKISYKDKFTKGSWSSTYYVSPNPVSRSFLVEFFGLNNPDVESYKIEEE